MYSIVGLGNPGSRYRFTPHNAGFMVCDLLSFSFNFSFNLNNRVNGFVGSFTYYDKKIFALKPNTYMNLSGQSVSSFLSYYKLSLDKLIVIHDDIDMEFGKIKIKKNSSSGGHRGVESIIEALSSKNFIRIKIGVGRGETNPKEYVLGEFSHDELKIMEDSIEKAKQAALDIVNKGLVYAMNNYNKRAVQSQTESKSE